MGDVASVSAQLLTTNQSAVVFEIASRYGEQVTPALRKRAKSDRPIETPEGAAQAALAKLGDRTAVEQLKEELEGTSARAKRRPKSVRPRNADKNASQSSN